jgi:hypothetical protein
MALSLITFSSLSYAPVVPAHAASTVSRASVAMESISDLKQLAKDLNPAVGYWNPLGIGEPGLFLDENGILPYSDEQFIAWFRHAEIKHGRVAMAAFVGFGVQSNTYFPWAISGDTMFADIYAAGGPGAQWDALSTTAKLQIFTFIFIMELIGESSYAMEKCGQTHYMKGGKPGFFPSLKAEGVIPHPVPLDLFDPFGLTKKLTEEQKATKLLAEINNGRLAMIGIMGLCAASKGLIVPGLDSLPIAPYAGEYMAPFEGAW